MAENNPNRAIVLLTLGRLIANLPRRFPYVFLPPISGELGVSAASVQAVLATQSGVGMGSPLLGPISDQYGRKRTLLACMVALTAAAGVGVIAPVFGIFAVITVFFGVVKMIYDPTMQAYIAERVAYRQRGYAIGVTELSWAGSLVVVALGAGVLLEQFGLRAVFGGLMVIGAASAAALWRWLPGDALHASGIQRQVVTPLLAWRTIRGQPAAIGALTYSLTLMMANEIIYINYSLWIETTFDLTVTALGTATIVIAAAEVSGELVVIWLADRVGKRQLALGGAVASSLAYALLPWLDFHLAGALVGLFVVFVFVEMAIVSSIPLFTEVLPQARAVMMSSNVGAHSVGRLAGGLVGGIAYEVVRNFRVIGILALVVGLSAAATMRYLVAEQPEAGPESTGEGAMG